MFWPLFGLHPGCGGLVGGCVQIQYIGDECKQLAIDRVHRE